MKSPAECDFLYELFPDLTDVDVRESKRGIRNGLLLPRSVLLQMTTQSMDEYIRGCMKRSNLNKTELSALRIQRKKVKNRESAALSRKRRKAYINRLEQQLKQLRKENYELRIQLEICTMYK
jgi:hypothetical protein